MTFVTGVVNHCNGFIDKKERRGVSIETLLVFFSLLCPQFFVSIYGCLLLLRTHLLAHLFFVSSPTVYCLSARLPDNEAESGMIGCFVLLFPKSLSLRLLSTPEDVYATRYHSYSPCNQTPKNPIVPGAIIIRAIQNSSNPQL